MKIKQATAYGLHALMYMVRHNTQLPITAGCLAKVEGIPSSHLAKIFQRLVKANIVKASRSTKKGYVFARPPEEISLLELFEAIEEEFLFSDCFMRHCQCNGTPENCYIYACWQSGTKRVANLLTETNLVTAARNHPNHRFNDPAEASKSTEV
jgi:Rrf2 family protein